MGEFDADAALKKAKSCDVVVTSASLMAPGDMSNQYNTAFATAMSADPDFGPPVAAAIGTREPIAVLMFFRRSESAMVARFIAKPASHPAEKP